MRVLTPLVLSVVVASVPAAAQSADAVSTGVKQLYDGVQLNITESAEQFPEAEYDFRPTPDVRSFGELIGHIANSQFFFCSAATGESSPQTANYEQDVSDKAGLVEGLKASNAYCNEVYASMTDARGAEMTTFGQGQATRQYVLVFNVAHDNEHYGNLVTYMRLKDMVPPSTARTQSGQ